MAESKHDARRQKLAEVVMDVIARDGFDAVTVRRIAGEVGYSTAIVSHYFSDKQDMLLCAYRTFDDFARRLYERTTARDETDLVGYLLSLSALEEGGLARWRSFVAVWDKSLRDPDFAAELRGWTDQALRCIEALIAVRDPGRGDRRKLAERFLALIQGASIQLLFNPESWTVDQLRQVITAEIELTLGMVEKSSAAAQAI